MGSYLENMFDLTGKVAVVTGAAGQLGGEFVRALLGAGASVAAFDINLKNPKGCLSEIKSDKLILVEVDVAKKESISSGVKEVLSTLGEPVVLVNNAAIDIPPGNNELDTGPFETYSDKSWKAMMDVNLQGVFLCSQIIGGHMADKEGGSIINISSLYGMLSPDQRIYEYKDKAFFKPLAYSVSKAGVIHLTKYLATYWAKKKVRVNSLTLGGVFNHQDEEFIENYSNKVPLGRMAQKDEYNAALVFLASNSSSYMTGSNLVIDGGYSCW